MNKEEKTFYMEKHKIVIKNNNNGVSIWVNGRWVLDASLFNKEMKFSICNERMKEVKSKYDVHREFKFDKRCN